MTIYLCYSRTAYRHNSILSRFTLYIYYVKKISGGYLYASIKTGCIYYFCVFNLLLYDSYDSNASRMRPLFGGKFDILKTNGFTKGIL